MAVIPKIPWCSLFQRVIIPKMGLLWWSGWKTTQVGFGYGWYQPKYQGRGLKESDDGEAVYYIRPIPSFCQAHKGVPGCTSLLKLKILTKFKLNLHFLFMLSANIMIILQNSNSIDTIWSCFQKKRNNNIYVGLYTYFFEWIRFSLSLSLSLSLPLPLPPSLSLSPLSLSLSLFLVLIAFLSFFLFFLSFSFFIHNYMFMFLLSLFFSSFPLFSASWECFFR